MADTKEKLAVLVEQSEKAYSKFVHETSYMPNKSEFIADHLIANGVILDKDESKISSKWIPVSERLQDKEFWEHQKRFDNDLEVLVMIKGAKLPTTLYYTADGDFYAMTEDEVTFYLVTHWQPMPGPPKEG